MIKAFLFAIWVVFAFFVVGCTDSLNTSSGGAAPSISSDLVSTADAPLALVGGTIYVDPVQQSISDGVVLIRNGKIAAVGSRTSVQIPSETRILDCSGLTVTAGFWNSHVHFIEEKWADALHVPAPQLTAQLQIMLTRYGFTSVFDIGSPWENTRRLRDRIESGEVAGPRILSTGSILFPKTVPHMPDQNGLMKRDAFSVPADDGQFRTASLKLLDAGTDGIKVFAAGWQPPIVAIPESDIRAVVDEAHGRGKLVFAHPENRTGLVAAIQGGVDVLAHTTPTSGTWDETVLAMTRQRRVALIPTLKLYKYELGRIAFFQKLVYRTSRLFSSSEDVWETAIGQLRAWLGSGGTILFGTDVGYMNDYDPTKEYRFMAEAGMSFRQILASLTVAPAERFGESGRLGRLAEGFDGDVVVLNSDPSRSVQAFADVRYTIRQGMLVYSANQ